MTVSAANKKEGFIPGKTYTFDPPVATNCIIISGGKDWQWKSFAEGWCLKFENGVGVFQGKPVGEKNVHYFKVAYGPGSIATEE